MSKRNCDKDEENLNSPIVNKKIKKVQWTSQSDNPYHSKEQLLLKRNLFAKKLSTATRVTLLQGPKRKLLQYGIYREEVDEMYEDIWKLFEEPQNLSSTKEVSKNFMKLNLRDYKKPNVHEQSLASLIPSEPKQRRFVHNKSQKT